MPSKWTQSTSNGTGKVNKEVKQRERETRRIQPLKIICLPTNVAEPDCRLRVDEAKFSVSTPPLTPTTEGPPVISEKLSQKKSRVGGWKEVRVKKRKGKEREKEGNLSSERKGRENRKSIE